MSAQPILTRFFLVGVLLAAAVGWLWQWFAELSFDGMQHVRFWSEALVAPVVLLTAALAWKPWELPHARKTVGELHQERERLQERLRSANQLRQALGCSTVPFVRLDREGNAIEINPAAARCLASSGWSSFLGLELSFRRHLADRATLADAQDWLKKTLSMGSGEDFQAFEWKVVTPAGEQEIFQVVAGQLGPPLGGKVLILRRKNDRLWWPENQPDDCTSHPCDAA